MEVETHLLRYRLAHCCAELKTTLEREPRFLTFLSRTHIRWRTPAIPLYITAGSYMPLRRVHRPLMNILWRSVWRPYVVRRARIETNGCLNVQQTSSGNDTEMLNHWAVTTCAERSCSTCLRSTVSRPHHSGAGAVTLVTGAVPH